MDLVTFYYYKYALRFFPEQKKIISILFTSIYEFISSTSGWPFSITLLFDLLAVEVLKHIFFTHTITVYDNFMYLDGFS